MNHGYAISFKARHITPFSWPFKFLINQPFQTPHSFRVVSVLHDIRQAESHENLQSHTHFRWPFSCLCQLIQNFCGSLILNSFIFLSAEHVAINFPLGDISILSIQSSWACTDLHLLRCSAFSIQNGCIKPLLSANTIFQPFWLTDMDLMPTQLSLSIDILYFQLAMSHNLKYPPQSPDSISTSFGCITAQFIGLFCFSVRICCPFFLKSKIRNDPSSHAVYIIWSCFLKPTAVTFPLNTQNDLQTVLGLPKSQILHVLHMPTINLCLVSETYIRFGMRLYWANFIYSFGQFEPVLGSQNFMVPSQDPLASFSSILLQLNIANYDKCVYQIMIIIILVLQLILQRLLRYERQTKTEAHLGFPAGHIGFQIWLEIENKPITAHDSARCSCQITVPHLPKLADLEVRGGRHRSWDGYAHLWRHIFKRQVLNLDIASFTIGFQLDSDYIECTRKMLQQKVQGADYDLILVDVKNAKFRSPTNSCYPVDLVIMNPPFGTKQSGIDVKFLQFAMSICSGNIYSMHKSSTRKFLQKFCEDKGYKMQVIMQVKFPLKKRFNKYHKKQIAYTEVDIILVKPTKQLLESRSKQKQKQVQNQDIGDHLSGLSLQQTVKIDQTQTNNKNNTIAKVDSQLKLEKEESI